MAHIHLGRVCPSSSARRTRTSASAISPGFAISNPSVKAFSKRIITHRLEGDRRLSRSTGWLFGIDTVFKTAKDRFAALQRTAPYASRRGLALPMARVQRSIAAAVVAQTETIVAKNTKLHHGAELSDRTA